MCMYVRIQTTLSITTKSIFSVLVPCIYMPMCFILYTYVVQHGKDFGRILQFMKNKYRKKQDPFISNLRRNQVAIALFCASFSTLFVCQRNVCECKYVVGCLAWLWYVVEKVISRGKI